MHEDLKGLEIKVNEFGEIISNKSVEDLNKFLDKKLKDKKLKDRDDLDVVHEDESDEPDEEDVEIDEDTKRKLVEED